MKLAVLMTCHNRRETTLSCLRRLYACVRPEGVELDVWLNDDGSTDGTGLAVRLEFPAVNVIQGSGNDFWCGGMRRAWCAAAARLDYDGYLWLNDDTMLFDDALKTLLASSDAIVVGASRHPVTGEVTYSGRGEDGKVQIPNGVNQPCLMMNGNCVFVPRNVFSVLGVFPEYFTHSLGDYDYARRAAEANVRIFTASAYVGTCDNSKAKAVWTDPAQPFMKRWRSLYSPLSGVQPRVFFRYNYLHDGLWKAIRLLVQQHVRVILPGMWK